MEQTRLLETLLTEGERQLAAGNKAGALTQFQSAAELAPKSEQAWLGVAQATEDVDQAINALGQVLAMNPDNIDARNRRLALQVGNIRQGINANIQLEHENPLRRFGMPLAIGIVILILIVIALLVKDSFTSWLNQTLFVSRVQAAAPTAQPAVLPATWTPQPTPTRTYTPVPTNTPMPTATPSVVLGRINGTVNARSGPGTNFSVVGAMHEPASVVLVAKNTAAQYFQLHQPDDSRLYWVAMDFVDVSSGDISILPEVTVPTPTPLPTRRPPPPPPPPAPVYVFHQIKNQPNPYGPRCDRTLVQGTVWDLGYGNGYVPGTLVRVWVNGAIIKTDIAGSHPDSRPAFSGNRAYWEADFTANEPVTGLVAIVDANGQLLSPQYPFTLTGGDCHSSTSINELVIDFSH